MKPTKEVLLESWVSDQAVSFDPNMALTINAGATLAEVTEGLMGLCLKQDSWIVQKPVVLNFSCQ